MMRLEEVSPEHREVVLHQLRTLLFDRNTARPKDIVIRIVVLLRGFETRHSLNLRLCGVVDSTEQVAVRMGLVLGPQKAFDEVHDIPLVVSSAFTTLLIVVTLMDDEASETRSTGGRVRRRGIIAGTIGVTVMAAVATRRGFRRFEIREESMLPALKENDWVLARRRTGEVDRGSVVVIEDPTGSGMNLVKRVIGLPGEHMGIDGGRVTVNGALLADRWASGATEPRGMWHVPHTHVWLLGDNRGASASDGRILGPTPLTDVNWVVVARYWPRHRAGRIS